jgi:hypothetical protein
MDERRGDMSVAIRKPFSVGLVSLCALVGALVLSAPARAETCPNEQLRSEAHSTKLPDCRAYELVTPPFTESSDATMRVTAELGGFAGMSADGSRVAVNSTGNLGDAKGAPVVNDYVLTRTASGWSEADIDMPDSRFPASELPAGEPVYASAPRQASPDFGEFLYESPTNGRSGEGVGSFWIGEADGALHRLGPGSGYLLLASSDLSTVLFDGPGGLEEERDLAGEEVPPVPVGVDPSGAVCPAARYSAPPEAGGDVTYGYGGVSADGAVVFFYVPAEGCAPGQPAVGGIFARIEESQTVAISEPSAEDCAACDTTAAGTVSEEIDGASADGSKVFFTTTQPLLGSQTETSANIYEYDFEAPQASAGDPDGKIIHVTAGEWGPKGVEVVGPADWFTKGEPSPSLVTVSEDGSHVYFLADGALQGARNSQGLEAVEGSENLYVFERDAQFPAGRLSFIATTGGIANPSLTPDGQFLVFMSAADLTPGDTSKNADQVFEYDAETGELVRVSIGENGFNDNGNTDAFSADIPGQQRNYPLAVSNNGAYVVFESPDGLTPGALNGYVQVSTDEPFYAENVYEYHDGDVYLISDGQDTSFAIRSTGFGGGSAVQLWGLSPSGADIFFETADRLVPQALDTQQALYDARIDGGFPAPVSLLPTCTGDACQGQLSPAPTLLSPGSEFQAGGNPPLVGGGAPNPATPTPKKVSVPKCSKGKKLSHGKCVKVKRKKKPKKAKKSNRAANDRRGN